MVSDDTTNSSAGRHTARKNAARDLAARTGMPYTAALRQVTQAAEFSGLPADRARPVCRPERLTVPGRRLDLLEGASRWSTPSPADPLLTPGEPLIAQRVCGDTLTLLRTVLTGWSDGSLIGRWPVPYVATRDNPARGLNNGRSHPSECPLLR